MQDFVLNWNQKKILKVANLEDIIAMKIEAIITRGLKRDFVDIYFAIKKYGVKKY